MQGRTVRSATVATVVVASCQLFELARIASSLYQIVPIASQKNGGKISCGSVRTTGEGFFYILIQAARKTLGRKEEKHIR